MKIFYLPLEPYQERYTDSLTGWTVKRFQKYGLRYEVISGAQLKSDGVQTGTVLDAHGRAYFGCSQIANLAERLRGAEDGDVIYLDDMFTPGYEGIPYILDQMDVKVRIYARNHAQSIDIDDFTFPMRKWMRHYEEMVTHTVDGIILGSPCHADLMRVTNIDHCDIYALGLPFDREAVMETAGLINPLTWDERTDTVIYASRFDAEKQPHFFMDVVELMESVSVNFVICTGQTSLRSNDPSAVARARTLAGKGKLRIVEGATKKEYYKELSRAKVQFNCAKQDFISYTAIEASTLGTRTVAPAYKSFIEVYEGVEQEHLFVPWNRESAMNKIMLGITTPPGPTIHHLAYDQHTVLDRICEVLKGEYHADAKDR